MTSYIKSVQQFVITIGTGQTSNTATISSVTTGNCTIFWGGYTSTDTSANFKIDSGDCTLTNATTVTVNRGASDATFTVTVYGTVIEFTAAGINSASQFGTITIAASGTSNTATITAVGSDAVAFYLGFTAAATNSSTPDDYCTIALTNSTTVTATRATAGIFALTVSYCILDLAAAVVNSAPQARSVSMTNSGAGTNTATDTITSVTTGNTVLIWNGATTTATSLATSAYTIQLTNATTVTLTRNGTNGGTRVVKYTVLEFASGVLKSSVQRGTITVTSATSAIATISSISTTYGLVNFCGYETNQFSPLGEVSGALTFTNATTVTAEVGVSNATANVISYEAFEFTPPSGASRGLFIQCLLDGITTGGSFFANPIG